MSFLVGEGCEVRGAESIAISYQDLHHFGVGFAFFAREDIFFLVGQFHFWFVHFSFPSLDFHRDFISPPNDGTEVANA